MCVCVYCVLWTASLFIIMTGSIFITNYKCLHLYNKYNISLLFSTEYSPFWQWLDNTAVRQPWSRVDGQHTVLRHAWMMSCSPSRKRMVDNLENIGGNRDLLDWSGITVRDYLSSGQLLMAIFSQKNNHIYLKYISCWTLSAIFNKWLPFLINCCHF